MKKNIIRTLSLGFALVTLLPFTAAATSSEANYGGIYIDENNNRFVYEGEESKKVQTISPRSAEDCAVQSTTTNDVMIRHCGWKDYDDNYGNWRASSWTTAIRNGIDVRHYSEAQVVNAFTGGIVSNSGRVYGNAIVYAHSGYVKASNPGYAMRSYWGFD
ncbi:hypothetical protein YDYSY3_49020 [Paenibacillus chitinolyticus]|uniref:hypothetical protein n=1 Tax=Paenibacillus chitinolyticus TaxID=79263 RepID=UPI0026E4DBFA|nr:hypothetical protein [Paenibacillus chitinolyticus]GKS13902.1 hypothetical protein YDYSY3_49020 [Paenibacillus chitinolyticus]